VELSRPRFDYTLNKYLYPIGQASDIHYISEAWPMRVILNDNGESKFVMNINIFHDK